MSPLILELFKYKVEFVLKGFECISIESQAFKSDIYTFVIFEH